MATPQLHRRWVLLGGWKTHWCPWDAAPTPHCTRMCTVASLGDSSFWFSRAVAAGVSWGAPCAHKASMAPAAAPPPCWGCPRSLTCLVCFAVLGWSRHRPLGHLSPPTPSLLLLDQVGPWATVPCLPAPPRYHRNGLPNATVTIAVVWGAALPAPAQLPHTVTQQSQYCAIPSGQTCPPSSAGRHWDPHRLSHDILLSPAHHMDRHPKPIGVTSTLASAPPPSFGAGNEEPKSPSPSLHSQCFLPNKADSFPPRNIFPVVLCCSLKPSSHPPLVQHRAASIHQHAQALGGCNTQCSEDVVR